MNTNKTRINKYATALATSTALICSSSAATIMWGAFDNDAAEAEISTNGTVVQAIDIVSTDGLATGTTVVNGVTFTRTNLFGNSYGFSSGVTTADAATDALYANLGYNGGTVTLTGLTEGDQYEIQAFFGDNRGGGINTRMMNVGDGTTVATTSTAAGSSGSWIIGTFTADASGTQGFHAAFGTNVSSEFNAYQLRNVTVPEPSSTALLGLGGLALILRRRK